MSRIFCTILLFYSAITAAFEDTPQIHISEIIPPSLAQSISYRVTDGILIGRYIRFDIESEFGNYSVDSLPMLVARTREIKILDRAVNQVNKRNRKRGEYRRGEYSVSADSALDILSRPIATATDVAGQVRDNLENASSEGSPNIRGKDAAGGGIDENDPAFVMHKRNIASQWGLDVYSSNPMVQKFLNDTASARSAGRIAAGAPAISRRDYSPFKLANMGLEQKIGLLIKNKTVAELEADDNLILSRMGIANELRLQFLRNRQYSPYLRTAVIRYLNLLQNVANRSIFIKQALTADSESAALGYEIAVIMLVHYHNEVAPLLRLNSSNNILEGITRDNQILFLPLNDIIFWSEDNEKLFKQLNIQVNQDGYKGKEILTAGEITEEASARLKDLGFVLRKKMLF